jgi:hypothetical protein
MAREQYLRIKDFTFDIEKTFLNASITEDAGLTWNLFIDAHPSTVHSQTWSPSAYLEDVPWAVNSIGDMNSTPILIPDGEQLDDGTILPDSRLCCLYVFSHNFLRDSTTCIRQISGDQFNVFWTAICDVFFDDEYGCDLPLEIEARVSFYGIETRHRQECSARDLLAKHFDDSQLIFDPTPEFATSRFVFRA